MNIVLIGIDPSLKRTGICAIDIKSKEVYIEKVLGPVGCKSFDDVLINAQAMKEGVESFFNLRGLGKYISAIMEIPPPMGQFSSGLWGLDILLASHIVVDKRVFQYIAIPPNYLAHLHGTRKYTKTESVDKSLLIIAKLIEIGYEVYVEGKCVRLNSTQRKGLCHDMSESLIMASRLMYLHCENKKLNKYLEEIMPNIVNDKGYKLK